MAWAIVSADAGTILVIVDCTDSYALSQGYTQVPDGAVPGDVVASAGTIVTPPAPVTPVVPTVASWADSAAYHHEQAYMLLAGVLELTSAEVPGPLLTVLQNLAAGMLDVAQALWVVAAHLELRSDLPPALALLAEPLVAGSLYTTLAITPLSSPANVDDVMVGTGLAVAVVAAANTGATALNVAPFVPSANVAAGTLLTASGTVFDTQQLEAAVSFDVETPAEVTG